MKDKRRANRLMRTFGGAGDSSPRVITEEAEEALQEAKKEVQEADVDVGNIIKELISTSWGGSNEEQMKATQLLKGIALSEDPRSNKFMQALDKLTSGMNPEDYK